MHGGHFRVDLKLNYSKFFRTHSVQDNPRISNWAIFCAFACQSFFPNAVRPSVQIFFLRSGMWTGDGSSLLLAIKWVQMVCLTQWTERPYSVANSAACFEGFPLLFQPCVIVSVCWLESTVSSSALLMKSDVFAGLLPCSLFQIYIKSKQIW